MSDRVVSAISSSSYTCVDLLGREICYEPRKWSLGVRFCFLMSDFSNLKFCTLTRRFYAGKQLKSGLWPSRPWIFHLAGVCLLSTFHFCLLKIWLTEPAARETPFSSDKGPVRGKGSFKGSRICVSCPASEGVMQSTRPHRKHGTGMVSVPLKRSSGWKTSAIFRDCVFRDYSFLGHRFNNQKY